MFDVYYTDRWPIIDCYVAVWISFRPSVWRGWCWFVGGGVGGEGKNHNSRFKTVGWWARANVLENVRRASPFFYYYYYHYYCRCIIYIYIWESVLYIIIIRRRDMTIPWRPWNLRKNDDRIGKNECVCGTWNVRYSYDCREAVQGVPRTRQFQNV